MGDNIPKEIKKPAVKIQQGPLVLYSSVFTVGDFMLPNFYDVDRLDVARDKGFQRILDANRAKRLANDIKDAWKNKPHRAFLPTSVLLATDRDLAFKDGQIYFRPSEIFPFNVVDGQHRIEGLKLAAKEDNSLREFSLAVNIAVGIEELTQTLHFLIVNTTQKSVDKGVEQRILARFTKMKGVEDIPWLPQWLDKEVNKNNFDEAIAIVDHLNSTPASPWYGQIQMANEPERRLIPQRSFVSNLRQMILTPNHPLKVHCKPKQRPQIMENYWKAITNLLVPKGEEDKSIVLKNNGLWFFHFVSPAIFTELVTAKNFKVKKIEECFRSAFDEMEAGQIAYPEFWRKGGEASQLNRAALLALAKELNDAMMRARQAETGEVKL